MASSSKTYLTRLAWLSCLVISTTNKIHHAWDQHLYEVAFNLYNKPVISWDAIWFFSHGWKSLENEPDIEAVKWYSNAISSPLELNIEIMSCEQSAIFFQSLNICPILQNFCILQQKIVTPTNYSWSRTRFYIRGSKTGCFCIVINFKSKLHFAI